MIPVSAASPARRSRVFGLGGSGLASARALVAGGAEVVAWDDSADERRRRRAQAGIATADLAPGRLVAVRRAGARARRAADPSGAALDRAMRARRPASRSSATSSCSAASARTPAPDCAVRRHHRHQRQIDHHRADRTSAASAGRDAQIGGNIGTAVLALEPPRGGPRPCARVSSYQIDLAPSLDPTRRHPAQHLAGPSRPPRHAWSTTPRSRSGWSRACRAAAPR